MIFGLIPVKDLSKAKERLSSILPQEDRTALAYAMLEDVLKALKGTKLIDRLFIVTMDRRTIEIAGALGIEVIEETEQKGESHSVDYASRICMEKGAESVLVIPGDAPLITSEDIDSIVEKERDFPSVILIPARDDYGTNAILRKPPDVIPSRFGEDSFRKHMDEARERGIHCDTYRNSRIALDIDHPDDLEEFLSEKSDTKTFEVLSELNLGGKYEK
jgi:2-phospho-L-lactate guanylyltransferase